MNVSLKMKASLNNCIVDNESEGSEVVVISVSCDELCSIDKKEITPSLGFEFEEDVAE